MGELLAGYQTAGATPSIAAVARATDEIIAEAPPLLRRIRDDLREYELEEAARDLLRDAPRFSRLDDKMARLELIGLAKRNDKRWGPRNALLETVFGERLGVAARPPLPRVGEGEPRSGGGEGEPAAGSREAGSMPDREAVVEPPANAERRAPVHLNDWSEREPVDPNWRRSRPSAPRQGLPILSVLRLAFGGAFLLLVIGLFVWSPWSGNGSSAPDWVPELVEIPAGPFLMGSSDADPLADDDEKPQHEVELPAYWIGKTEVTNAQFRPFVEGDGYSTPDYWTEAGWQWREEEGITEPAYWNEAYWNGDEQPVVGVSWFEAAAYVRWLSAQTGHAFRLPTEAEWEKAARGPDGLIWPWGDEWNPELANANGAIGKTTPVGQYPDGASPYGALDMAGNAWEWCATQQEKGYPYALEDEWATEYLEADATRVLRGGSWYSEQKRVRGAYRSHYNPRYRSSLNGMRVASHSPLPGEEEAAIPTATKPPLSATIPEPTPLPAWVPELVKVPAGPFLMGSSDADPLADDDEKPQHEVELPAYWIGKTEVTNAQFRPFVEGDGYSNPDYWTEAGWQWREEAGITEPAYWDDANWNGAEQPVVGVSWFEAAAYVRWLSAQTGHAFRLPTEAEWEKAARGPDGLIWPWGDEWNPELANANGAIGKTAPVGQYPDGASPYGALDMAGNAWEWCATQWEQDYPYALEDEWATEYLEADATRVFRGGSWYSEQQYVGRTASTTTRATAATTTGCGSPVILPCPVLIPESCFLLSGSGVRSVRPAHAIALGKGRSPSPPARSGESRIFFEVTMPKSFNNLFPQIAGFENIAQQNTICVEVQVHTPGLDCSMLAYSAFGMFIRYNYG